MNLWELTTLSVINSTTLVILYIMGEIDLTDLN